MYIYFILFVISNVRRRIFESHRIYIAIRSLLQPSGTETTTVTCVYFIISCITTTQCYAYNIYTYTHMFFRFFSLIPTDKHLCPAETGLMIWWRVIRSHHRDRDASSGSFSIIIFENARYARTRPAAIDKDVISRDYAFLSGITLCLILCRYQIT